MRLLNLGCGNSYHKDWLNIDFRSRHKDVIGHDLLKGIPIKNSSIDVVYHSHILEHFSKENGLKFIHECYRVLKTNGIIRIAVPDLEIIVNEYLKNLKLALEGDIQAKANYEWIKLELLDQMVRNESGGNMKKYLIRPFIVNEDYVFKRIGSEGRIIRESYLESKAHVEYGNKRVEPKVALFESVLKKMKMVLIKLIQRKRKNTLTAHEREALQIGKFRLGGEIHQWMYDRYSLAVLLQEAGFKEITVCDPFRSNVKNWQSYQLDVIDGEVRKPDSLFMEAVKK